MRRMATLILTAGLVLNPLGGVARAQGLEQASEQETVLASAVEPHGDAEDSPASTDAPNAVSDDDSLASEGDAGEVEKTDDSVKAGDDALAAAPASDAAALSETEAPSNTIVAHPEGWDLVDGRWYYFNQDGAKHTGWLKLGSTWYWLDPQADGAMASGWYLVGGAWYYSDASGAMRTGWLRDNGTWYYLGSSGAMHCGWLLDGGSWYWLDATQGGAMAVGTAVTDGLLSGFDSSGRWTGYASGWRKDRHGTWFYADAGGRVKTGWQHIGGSWYWLEPSRNGAMATGWALLNGSWYYLNPAHGAMCTGWVHVGGSWYSLSGSGAMRTGWYLEQGAWYYLDAGAGGAMAQGLFAVGGETYYAYGSGALATSCWVATSRGAERYAQASGALLPFESRSGVIYASASDTAPASGWMAHGSLRFYVDPQTHRLSKGWKSVDGAQRYFDAQTGAMKTGWLKDGAWYLLGDDGAKCTGWRLVNGAWYYLDPDSDGRMATGITCVDGKWYNLDASGAMRTGWRYVPGGETWQYYEEGSGARVHGVKTVDGRTYLFDANTGIATVASSYRGRRVAAEAARRDRYGYGSGWCQAWVCTAYERVGESGDTRPCAYAAWQAWGVSSSGGAIPVGATVYSKSPVGSHGWSGGVYYPDFGHVGIYIGNGKVASLRGGVVIEPVEDWTTSADYLGWGWNGGIALA